MPAILDEWFNGTLAAWTVSGADIVTADNDEKLRLNASGEFAQRDFTAPATGPLIVESDLRYSASGVQGYFEVIDSAGPTALAAVRFTGGNAYVSTDTDGETAHAFAAGTYRQFILAFDQDAATVRFYISGADQGGRNGTWDLIAQSGYSGGTIDRLRVRTTTGGTVYADMVQVFVPDAFVMGDSIADGKPNWSEQPNFATDAGGANGRLGPNEDEEIAPAYQLGLVTGEHVAARAFGAATSTQILSGVGSGGGIQELFLDQHGRHLYLQVGHNDLYANPNGLPTLQANIQSVFNTLTAAGIAPDAITLCKIAPSDLFEGTPSGDEANRIEYNRWLADFCAQNGCRLAFNCEALNDNTKTSAYKRLNPAYDVGDGTHMNKAGTAVLAAEMFRARVPGGVLRRAGAGLAPASFLTDAPAVATFRDLAYFVRPDARRVADVVYALRTTPAPTGKATAYRVAMTPATAPKTLAYILRATGVVQRGAPYRVRAAGAVVKGMAYDVDTGASSNGIPLPAAYAVDRPVGIGVGLTYDVGTGGAAGSIQRGCSYVVEVTTATYYVAPAANGGSDANPGTLAQPWETVAHAMATLQAGELGLIREGTYLERGLDFANSGTYAANQLRYIRIAGYPGESVVIDGEYTGSGSSVQPFLTDSGKDYISIENMEIINAYYQAWYTGNSSPATRLRARGLHIHDVYGWVGDNAATIRWDNVTDGLVDSCVLHTVHNTGTGGPLCNVIMTYNNVRWEIRNSEIHDGDNLVFQKNADPGGGDGMIVHHNVLHDGAIGIRYGLQGSGSPPHHNQTAHHNVMHSLSSGCIYGELDYASGISDGFQAYNNTLVAPRPITFKGGFLNQQIWNNIVVCTGGSGDWRLQEMDGYYGGVTNTITYMDFNLYDSTYPPRNWNLQVNLGSAYSTSSFTAWQALTSSQPDLLIDNPDANGMLADPLFTNAGAYDYSLQSGSPAIGAGRFGGDIGALESTGVPPSTITPIGSIYVLRTTPAAGTKSAAYAVATPASAALGLAYEVVPPPGLAACALTYAVRATAPGTSAAQTYAVGTQTAPLARPLAYAIDPAVPVALAKGLAYRVTAAPVRLLGLAYRMGGEPTGVVRSVAVPPEPHGAAVAPEPHTVQVMT